MEQHTDSSLNGHQWPTPVSWKCPRHPAGHQRHPTKATVVHDSLSHTTTCIISGHQPRTHIQSKLLVMKINVAAECERVSVSSVIFSFKFPIWAHARTLNTKYRKRVMRFLTPSPMLPLSLILCYINYILNESHMVLLVSAPSIHGNCKFVPTIRVSHASTQTHSWPRNRAANMLEWQEKIGDERTSASLEVCCEIELSCSSISPLNQS